MCKRSWARHDARGPAPRVSPRPGPAAFTLVELLLVCALLVLVAGAMAPRMSHAYRRLELESEAREIVSVMDAAAGLAIRGRMATRLAFAPQGSEFWIERDDPRSPSRQFAAVQGGPLEGRRALPMRMVLQSDEGDGAESRPTELFVEFYADGTCAPSLLQLADREGRSMWIRVGSQIGSIEILKERPSENQGLPGK